MTNDETQTNGPTSGAAPDAAPVQNGTPEEQLAKAQEDARKYLANWQRSEADFQNYKRRTEQERDELRKFSTAALLMNLLPVLDDFERAFSTLDRRLWDMTWFEGVQLIYRKLENLLRMNGVTPIDAAPGQPFDPRFQEAVSHADGEDGKVVAEVQRGYKMGERVLRPAMVVVGKGTAQENTEQENKEQGEQAQT